MTDNALGGGGSIPYGLDPHTKDYCTIDEADPQRRYVCPVCGRLLDQRRGEENKPYFAHSRVFLEENNCPQYRGGYYTPTENRSEVVGAARRIRLFIKTSPFSQTLALFGTIPPLTFSDIPTLEKWIQKGYEPATSKGTISPMNLQRDLLPDSAVEGIKLNPDAETFEILIATDLSNGGEWKSRKIQVGDSFIGDSESAERVENPEFLTSGQYIYRIIRRGEKQQMVPTEIFTLGEFDVVRVLIAETNETVIHDWLPTTEIDSDPFKVDVILPLEENPKKNWLDRIPFCPGDEITLCLTPPPGTDTRLEILPIPFKEQELLVLDKAGLGVPRFVKVRSEEEDAFRLLIHWPYVSSRDILLDFFPSTDVYEPISDTYDLQAFLEVKFEGKSVTLDPLEKPLYRFAGRSIEGRLTRIPEFTLVHPPFFEVHLRAKFNVEGNMVFFRDEGDSDKTNIQDILEDIFHRGAVSVRLDFASLGVITVECEHFQSSMHGYEQSSVRSEGEIINQREVIRKARNVKRVSMIQEVKEAMDATEVAYRVKISNRFTKRLLDLPQDTTYAELRVYRNLIRRRRKELRKSQVRAARSKRNMGREK